MAKKFKCIDCAVPKVVKDDFYTTSTKLGHDRTCKECRSAQAAEYLRLSKAGISPSRRKVVNASRNYVRKQNKIYTPTPEQIAHGTWLIRAEHLIKMIFFKGFFDREKCSVCLRQGICGITGDDYYDDFD